MPAADGLDRIRARIGERPAPRFGWSSSWSWFTASWARPALAGAASLVMAAVVVTAQPAISSFTVGGHGAPEQGEHGSNSTTGATSTSDDEEPAEPMPGHAKTQGTVPPTQPLRTPVAGAPVCGRPATPGGPAVSSTADTSPAGEQPPTCTAPTEETSPTPPPEGGGEPPPVDPPPPVTPPTTTPPTGGEQPLQMENP
ncbi:hypothetical protein GCM10009780_46980 [Actinomadura alba]